MNTRKPMDKTVDKAIKLTVCECFGRDGLQSFPEPLLTKNKVEILSRVIAAGFRKVEVTSFVPARYIPQFADAVDILAAIPRPQGIRLVAFIPNARGAQSAVELAPKGIAPTDFLIVISASETHNQRNLNRTWEETRDEHHRVAKLAAEAGISLIGSIATSFGCPYTGTTPIDNVFRMVDHYLELGVREVQFGDTTGMANPLQVEGLYRAMFERFPALPAIAHFHDVRGVAMANTLAAVQAGVRSVDCALGGTGGRPHYQRLQNAGPTGNLCTEDFVALAEQMGFNTGLDPAAVLAIGALVEEYTGQMLFSHTLRSGLTTDLKGETA